MKQCFFSSFVSILQNFSSKMETIKYSTETQNSILENTAKNIVIYTNNAVDYGLFALSLFLCYKRCQDSNNLLKLFYMYFAYKNYKQYLFYIAVLSPK